MQPMTSDPTHPESDPGAAQPPTPATLFTCTSDPLSTAAPQAPASLPQVAGFEVERELGRGGMGVVYLARQTALKRPVALKLMSGQGGLDAEAAERFRREAEATAGLQHPNIVQIYEVGQAEGVPYFALEFVAGGSLDRALAGKPLPPKEATSLVEVLARAMQHAHERGIVHRDLKPANVLLAVSDASQKRSGEQRFCEASLNGCVPKITDFGLAKKLETDNSQTRSGSILGTPSYMAPEQAQGHTHAIGPAADIHALGAILYECLTGRPPFSGANVLETLEQVVSRDPVPPARLNPGVPRDLDTVCLKCLHKDPGRRYSSALELAEDLRRFLDGQPIRARPVGRLEQAWRWCQRKPAVAALLAALVLVLAGGFAAVLWQLQRVQRQRDVADARLREAERNLRLAIDTNLSVGELAEELRPLAGTRSETVRRILSRTQANYERLLREAGATPHLLQGKARMLNSFSELYLQVGDSKAALAAAEKARDLFRGLLAEHGLSEEDRRSRESGLGESLERRGRVLLKQGRTTDAVAGQREALAIRRRLASARSGGQAQRDLIDSLAALGEAHIQRGDWPRADKHYREALQLCELLAKDRSGDRLLRSRLAGIYGKLGDVQAEAPLNDLYDVKAALAWYRKGRALMDDLLRLEPDNAEYEQQWIHLEENVGFALMRLGQREAVEHLETALRRAERLLAKDPESFARRFLHFRCAYARARLRTDSDLVEVLRRQKTLISAMAPRILVEMRKDPLNYNLRRSWLHLNNEQALGLLALARAGDQREENLKQARAALETALAVGEKLLREDPEHHEAMMTFWYTHYCRSQLLALEHDEVGARRAKHQAHDLLIASYEHRCKREPDHPLWERGLADAFTKLGTAYFQEGESQKARAQLDKAQPILERLHQRQPREARWPILLADLYELRGDIRNSQVRLYQPGWEAGNRDIIQAHEREARYREQALKLASDRPDQAAALAAALRTVYMRHNYAFDRKGAEAAFGRHLEALQRFHQLSPDADPLAPVDKPTLSQVSLLTSHSALWSLMGSQRKAPRPPLRVAESSLVLSGQPSRRAELLYYLAELLRGLDASKPNEVEQGRWALRRGLSLLYPLRDQNELPPAWESYLAAFEKHFKSWPTDRKRPAVTADLAASLDRLDYARVVEYLTDAGRIDQLLDVLLYEAKSVATLEDLKGTVFALWLEAVVGEPRAARAVLRAASERLERQPATLGSYERELLAEMARLHGDLPLVRRFDAAILDRPTAGWLNNLITPLQHRGQVSAAARLRRAWHQTQPPAQKDSALSWRFTGFVEAQAGEFALAEKALAQVRQKAPDDPGTRVLAGYLALGRRQFRQTLTELEVIKRGDKAAVPWLGTIARLIAVARHELGETVDTDAESLRDDDSFGTRAWLRLEQGKDPKNILAEVERKLRQKPRMAFWKLLRGAALLKAGQSKEALDILERLADRESMERDPAFWFYLGEARVQAGKKEEARQAWQRGLTAFPETTARGDRRRVQIEHRLQGP
jgi:serine/threonine protein kinase/Tfp pilus assembly protein PilF